MNASTVPRPSNGWPVRVGKQSLLVLLGGSLAHLAGSLFLCPARLSDRAHLLERAKFPRSTRCDAQELDQDPHDGLCLEAYLRSVAASACCSLITSAAAFPFAYLVAFRLSTRARLFATCLLVVPFFTSYLVRVYTWRTMLGQRGAVNNLLAWIGLPPQTMTDNFFGVMVGFVTLTLPLVCLLHVLSLSYVDKRLVEAAHNLGARPLTTVVRVIIPSARTGLILGVAFAFVLSFGDFVSPDLLGGRNPPLVSLLIIDQVKGGSNWPAAAVIAMIMVTTLVIVVLGASRLAYPAKMRRTRSAGFGFGALLVVVYAFIYAPIVISFIFSFSAERFPTIPLGGVSLQWYGFVWSDPDVHTAFWRSVNVASLAAPIAVFIGFGAAYTDYRSNFFGKTLYLTLGLLPPLVPVLILGVAMLFFFARVGLFGGLYSIVISHVVLCTPFAFTVVRLRLTQVNPALEQAAWNLGAGPWRARIGDCSIVPAGDRRGFVGHRCDLFR